MIQSLRQIRNRIRSVGNIQKLTRAMEMISAAKLKLVHAQLNRQKLFFSKIDEVFGRLSAHPQAHDHPLFEDRRDHQKAIICLLTSDSGLCGSYNSHIIQKTEQFAGQRRVRLQWVVIGKKGIGHFKRSGYPIRRVYCESCGRYSRQTADDIAADLISGFFAVLHQK